MSGVIEVTAKRTVNDEAVTETIPYDFGADHAEMVEKFGEDTVFANARANMKVKLQATMGLRMKAGQPCDDLTDKWRPDAPIERVVDPFAAAKALFATKSDEEKRAFLEELQAAG